MRPKKNDTKSEPAKAPETKVEAKPAEKKDSPPADAARLHPTASRTPLQPSRTKGRAKKAEEKKPADKKAEEKKAS